MGLGVVTGVGIGSGVRVGVITVEGVDSGVCVGAGVAIAGDGVAAGFSPPWQEARIARERIKSTKINFSLILRPPTRNWEILTVVESV